MKKTLFATGLAMAMALPFGASAADYVIDNKGAHASVNFKVSHLGYSFIKGRFNTFEGDFSYDPANISASKVEVTIDTTSLDSNHAERDKHIRSSDLLTRRSSLLQHSQAQVLSIKETANLKSTVT